MSEAAQDGVNACLLAAAIEPCAIASWPARETATLDGWLLRFSDGYSHRASSVAAVEDALRPLGERIAAAERAYRARHLAPLFQITPLSAPPGLETALKARGYVPEAPTAVMVRNCEAEELQDTSTEIVARDHGEFARLVVEGSRSPDDGRERIATILRISRPCAGVLVFDGGRAVAAGLCVAGGAWAGIYVMRTTPAARRRGHARRALARLSHWAREHGATGLYLQVETANAPARALYARSGFRDAYPYRFYRAP